ncbi:MAG: hypothetical protein A2340_09885 [Lentisphaerae bacterium RIFOXYB12_FULL_60_10]|nr:MAG: hypothetical protein A2340_09885 [Lentisphaerae bacterium RIFOXYB12_FULL_60_10]
MKTIVESYIVSDKPLSQILDGQEYTPLLAALSQLCQFLDGKPGTNGAFLAARKIHLPDADPNLVILFLCRWADAIGIQSQSIPERLQEAWALVVQAEKLRQPETPLEINAQLLTTQSHLAGMEGNRIRQESLLQIALKTLPGNSPRFKDLYLEMAALMARSGRLSSMGNILPEIVTTASHQHQFNALRYLDAIETGRWELANQLSEPDRASIPAMAPLHTAIRHATILANILGHLNLPIDLSDLPDWALSLRCLLEGRTEQALKWARVSERNHPVSLTGIGWTAYSLMRAELATGQTAAASRILRLRHEQGNLHYLDTFFEARIAILENRMPDALKLLRKLQQPALDYQAFGRLAAELKLSVELSREQLIQIAPHIPSLQETPIPLPSVSPSPRKLAPPISEDPKLAHLIGNSSVMQSIRVQIHQLAPLDVPVLITGETGTGKELVARAIHDLSPRHKDPFIAVNCGAIAESLLESELFGHEKGAFSGASQAHRGLFEEAADGSILLDEIGDIPPRLQVALLRVLETGDIRPVGSARTRTIRARILAATNANLPQLSETGKFRKDLLYRLQRMEIDIPPLRERSDDILPLAYHFLNEGRPSNQSATLAPALRDHLTTLRWEGNIRELRNRLERMRLLTSDRPHYELTDFLGISEPSAPAMAVRTQITDVPPKPPVAWSKGRSHLRRLEQLRRIFDEQGWLTRQEIIQMMGVSSNTATEDLRRLGEAGFIQRVQPSRSPRSVYFIRTGTAQRP